MAKDFKIKDFLKRIKNTVEIKDGISYKRVTVSGNHKGVSLRDKVDGSKIGTKKQFTITGGDFILSKIDARNGAFGIIPKSLDGAIITGNFWTYKVDTQLVDIEWFFYFTHSFNFIQICIESSTGSTHRKYLDEKVFLNHNIVLPSKAEQIEMVKRYKEQSKVSNNLSKEIRIQKSTLSQLKQAILQEAINGKLTQDWRKQNPNTEPASELLERIKGEKKQLIKNKKIRKEKSLPQISKEEIPFEIPESWVWCKLGEINNSFLGGSAFKSTRFLKKSDIQVIRISNVKNDKLDLVKNAVFIDALNAEENSRNELYPNDIIITMTGTRSKRDYCYTVILKDENFTDKRLFLNQRVGCFRLNHLVNSNFLCKVLKSKHLMEPVFQSSTGSANQANISKNALLNILIPLPPIAEQKAIVEKVETLMQKCNALEQEITQSEQYANMLMQAVLKEAFESKTEQETKVVKLNTKPTNIDYYKRILLATEIVWQLHKEPTLGHLKLQKLMYLTQESGKMQLPTNFLQQVAGPYDPQMARSLDKQMKTKKWFEFKRGEFLKFKPLEKAGEHKADFEKFFANQIDSIQYIIDTFKTAKSDQVEIVGTLYACWNKLIDEKQIVSDELLTKRFYEWSEEKAKFERNRIIKALRWMETKGIAPEYTNA